MTETKNNISIKINKTYDGKGIYIVVYKNNKPVINNVRGPMNECVEQLKNEWEKNKNGCALSALYHLALTLNDEGICQGKVGANPAEALKIFNYLKKFNLGQANNEKVIAKYDEIKKSLEECQNDIESSGVTTDSEGSNIGGSTVIFKVPNNQDKSNIIEKEEEEEEETEYYILEEEEEEKEPDEYNGINEINNAAEKLKQLNISQNLSESIQNDSSNEEEEKENSQLSSSSVSLK